MEDLIATVPEVRTDFIHEDRAVLILDEDPESGESSGEIEIPMENDDLAPVWAGIATARAAGKTVTTVALPERFEAIRQREQELKNKEAYMEMFL